MRHTLSLAALALLSLPAVASAHTYAPLDAEAWYGDVGLTTVAAGKVFGDRDFQWHASLEVDWAALVVAPSVGGGARFFAGDVWALRAHGSIAPLLLLSTSVAAGARADLGVVSEWRFGWGGLILGPRVDGAMSLLGDDEARFQAMFDLGVGVEIAGAEVWLIASPGWGLSRTGSDTLLGEAHLTLLW